MMKIWTSLAVAIIYGGGQIPTANFLMGTLAEKLLNCGIPVYGVRKSFWGLSSSENYEQMTFEKARLIQNQLGTYFQMCRKVVPSDDLWFDKILKTLQEFNIHTIFVCGGDGSLRGANDFAKRCIESDYLMRVIFIPCTIDGMNMTKTIGYDSAVRESIKQAELVAINALATWDYGYENPRISVIEVQGRNRNDILFGVADYFLNNTFEKYYLKDVNVIMLPAGYLWNIDTLMSKIQNNPSVIICSEGAKPEDFYWPLIQGENTSQKLKALIGAKGLKANNHLIGYLSQTNDNISDEEKDMIEKWCNYAIKVMQFSHEDKSFAIIKSDNCNSHFSIIKLEELAKQNSDSSTILPLSDFQLKCFEQFLV